MHRRTPYSRATAFEYPGRRTGFPTKHSSGSWTGTSSDEESGDPQDLEGGSWTTDDSRSTRSHFSSRSARARAFMNGGGLGPEDSEAARRRKSKGIRTVIIIAVLLVILGTIAGTVVMLALRARKRKQQRAALQRKAAATQLKARRVRSAPSQGETLDRIAKGAAGGLGVHGAEDFDGEVEDEDIDLDSVLISPLKKVSLNASSGPVGRDWKRSLDDPRMDGDGHRPRTRGAASNDDFDIGGSKDASSMYGQADGSGEGRGRGTIERGAIKIRRNGIEINDVSDKGITYIDPFVMKAILKLIRCSGPPDEEGEHP